MAKKAAITRIRTLYAIFIGVIALCIGLFFFNIINPADPLLNVQTDGQKKDYRGEVGVSYYGKAVPKHAHGTENLPRPSASGRLITQAALRIYDRTVDPSLLIRRITLMLNHAVPETEAAENVYEQMDLFTDYTARAAEEEALKKERRLQEAMLDIKQKFGKNAILKGINYEEGATGRERNRQIGGHKA